MVNSSTFSFVALSFGFERRFACTHSFPNHSFFFFKKQFRSLIGAGSVLLLLGSVLDYFRRKRARRGVYPQDGLIGKILRCWSVGVAFHSLRRCNCQQASELYAFHGMRTLFVAAFVWADCYLYGAFHSTLFAYSKIVIINTNLP